jgi:hypothetical protein
VLDAVESYNERWAELWQEQEQQRAKAKEGEGDGGADSSKKVGCFCMYALDGVGVLQLGSC